MKAADYFPRHYRADLQVFAEAEVPEHGPFWMLCGLTLGRVFEPGRLESYVDAARFLCTVYELNLLNQGIHRYFPDHHFRWLAVCEAFPDIRGCSYGHGGFTHAPSSIIRFSHDPSYIPGSRPIPISGELLREFTDFFFREYLSALCDRSTNFGMLTTGALVERLLRDTDCPEFSTYAETKLV